MLLPIVCLKLACDRWSQAKPANCRDLRTQAKAALDATYLLNHFRHSGRHFYDIPSNDTANEEIMRKRKKLDKDCAWKKSEVRERTAQTYVRCLWMHNELHDVLVSTLTIVIVKGWVGCWFGHFAHQQHHAEGDSNHS